MGPIFSVATTTVFYRALGVNEVSAMYIRRIFYIDMATSINYFLSVYTCVYTVHCVQLCLHFLLLSGMLNSQNSGGFQIACLRYVHVPVHILFSIQMNHEKAVLFPYDQCSIVVDTTSTIPRKSSGIFRYSKKIYFVFNSMRTHFG